MYHSCSITLNMLDMPWLDKPTQITESELDDLESNYEIMLQTVRNDTFGGNMPPQYNTKYINSTNINTKNNYSNDNDNTLLSDLKSFDINNSEIHESFERVQNELNNIFETDESLISSPKSIDVSSINIDLNDIQIDDCDESDIKNDSSHNLSLPFMSPTSLNRTDSQIMLPPIFNTSTSSISGIQPTQRRTQSEQQPNSHVYNNNNNNSTNSMNSAPQIAMSMSISQSIPPYVNGRIQMHQLNQTRSQILNNIGLPDSVTSSMMFTPSQSSFMSNRNNNSSEFEMNNAPQRYGHRNSNSNMNNNRRNINISDSIFVNSMANIIHGIQNDIQSNNIDHDNNNNNSSTQINIESRSNSISLDAPRIRNRRAM
eukprot:121640_1